MEQRRKKRLRIVLWLLAALWMSVIFAFSAQNAEDSERASDGVIRWLLTCFDKEFPVQSPEAQQLRTENWSFLVRKLAHFCVFAVLGCLTFAAFSVDLPPGRAFPAATGLGVVRAVLDEAHQSFVPGRSCELRDIGIDAAGVFLGAAFLLFVITRMQRKKLKR